MKANLFILCLILTVSAIGQKHRIYINYKPSFTYFGKQSQSFHNYYFTSRKGDQTFNSSVNILYNYKLSPGISFATGLEYSQQGQNVNFNADSAFPSHNRQILKIELNYTEGTEHRIPPHRQCFNVSCFAMTVLVSKIEYWL